MSLSGDELGRCSVHLQRLSILAQVDWVRIAFCEISHEWPWAGGGREPGRGDTGTWGREDTREAGDGVSANHSVSPRPRVPVSPRLRVPVSASPHPRRTKKGHHEDDPSRLKS